MPTALRIQRDTTAATQTTGQPATRRDQMKLTVFGATGGIGGHVVRQALAAGHHVTAVVRDPAQFDVSHPALEVATVPDLTDPDGLRAALEAATPRSRESARAGGKTARSPRAPHAECCARCKPAVCGGSWRSARCRSARSRTAIAFSTAGSCCRSSAPLHATFTWTWPRWRTRSGAAQRTGRPYDRQSS